MTIEKLSNSVLFQEWSEAKRVFTARSTAAHRTTETRAVRPKRAVTVKDGDSERDGDPSNSERPLDTQTGTGTETGTKTDISTLALTSPEVPAAGVFELPLPGEQGEWQVPQKLYDEMLKAFPDVSVMGEFAKMRAWLVTNPRKTAKGLPRFISNWLSKAQDDPRNRNAAQPKTPGGTYGKTTWHGRQR